jgi:hypothetical protein
MKQRTYGPLDIQSVETKVIKRVFALSFRLKKDSMPTAVIELDQDPDMQKGEFLSLTDIDNVLREEIESDKPLGWVVQMAPTTSLTVSERGVKIRKQYILIPNNPDI